MEMLDNKLVIDIPKGMEVDVEKSDLKAGIIAFKKKEISYADVLSALAGKGVCPADIKVPEMIAGKIIALARLMTIAKYYNGDWKPDWNSQEYKHNIMRTSEYGITSCGNYNEGAIYFKNKEDAQAVIDNPNFRSILDAIYKD
jgi:hypothetical protein|nr:MAG TPA: hypothetical protein [Caudoviricetes sp.]